jgi:hypothetical protein
MQAIHAVQASPSGTTVSGVGGPQAGAVLGTMAGVAS